MTALIVVEGIVELLFKREQSAGKGGGTVFKLWSKIELNEDEQAIVSKYKFDKSVLIFADQPGLIRKAIVVSAGATLVALFIVLLVLNRLAAPGALAALVARLVYGYWWYHQKRETIFVKDLLHGRDFSCDSVVGLAKKEAWIGTVVSYLRQVMESAKHWDGTERHTVEPLPKEDARQVIIKGL